MLGRTRDRKSNKNMQQESGEMERKRESPLVMEHEQER